MCLFGPSLRWLVCPQIRLYTVVCFSLTAAHFRSGIACLPPSCHSPQVRARPPSSFKGGGKSSTSAAGAIRAAAAAAAAPLAGRSGRSGGGVGATENDEGDDDDVDEEDEGLLASMLLPADLTTIDAEVLSTLPQSLQLEILDKMRDAQMQGEERGRRG